MRTILAVTFVVTALPVAFAQSADWPQWQGPARDAVSPAKGLLQQWPDGGPPLVWRVEGIGEGYGAPAIARGRMVGLSRRGDQEVLWARAVDDGELLWETLLGDAPAGGMRQGIEGAGGTPTIDGARVYAIGFGGALACVSFDDGKSVWTKSLIDDFGGHLPPWRYNESVLIDGDTLVCTPGGNQATMVALDKSDGSLRWQTVLEGHTDETPPPDTMGTLALLKALDKDGDRELSAAEVTSASAVLRALDLDGNGRLDELEVQGKKQEGERRRGGRGRGQSFMNSLKVLHALDADHSGVISDAEIEGAAAALRTLDVDGDRVLTPAEVSLRFPKPKKSGAGYSSAIAVELGGVRQYVQFTAKALVGVAADDGRLLWSYPAPAARNGINCSTPVLVGERVIAAAAYGTGGGMARVRRGDDGAFACEEVWFNKRMENQHGGMIVVGDALYGADGGNQGGFLACVDLESGETLWNAGDLGHEDVAKGSLAMADGRLYYRTEAGIVLLIEPDREGYVERGRLVQPERTSKPAWAHPVIANGLLFIRDQDVMYCYDVRTK